MTNQEQGHSKGDGRNRNRSRRRRRRRPDNRARRTNQQRKPYRGGNGQSTAMETRDETSAGGLVVSGLAECVDANGQVDLSRLYVALIGRLDRRGPPVHLGNWECAWFR